MSAEKDSVVKILGSIEKTVEMFYQQKQQQGLSEFEDVIVDIARMVDILFKYKAENEGFSLDEKKVLSILEESEKALLDKDYVLLADILQYDFVGYIEEIIEDMD